MVGAGVVTLRRTVLEWHQGDLEDGRPWGGRGHLVGKGYKLISPPEGEQVRADPGGANPSQGFKPGRRSCSRCCGSCWGQACWLGVPDPGVGAPNRGHMAAGKESPDA